MRSPVWGAARWGYWWDWRRFTSVTSMFQRRRLLAELRMSRITADELHRMQEAGENLVILDLRSALELEQNPSLIRGARHMTMEELRVRQHEIPRDRDIILYCSCPNEVSSARMALFLRRSGILRVRPLLGGIDAWRERNYPMELRPVGIVSSVECRLREPGIRATGPNSGDSGSAVDQSTGKFRTRNMTER